MAKTILAGNHHKLAIVVGSLAILVTFLPTMVAIGRTHPDRRKIAIANLLLFWTWAGWGAVMVWAVTGARSDALTNRLAALRARLSKPKKS